jgi:small subunit ribosomal protein S2
MKDVTLLELLKSGAHFGHTTSRWNPRMKPFIYTVRNNIHILDLAKTRQALLKAASQVSDRAATGGTVLFVGTKRQSRESIQKAAESCGMPYVTARWLGGTFTNFRTIQKTIRKLEKLQELKANGQLEAQYTKKERLLIEREMIKLEKLFSGIRNLRKLPEMLFVADINHDDTAVREARKMHVPVIGLVDSNSDPALVDFAIPCNDDATKAVSLVAGIIVWTQLLIVDGIVRRLGPNRFLWS